MDGSGHEFLLNILQNYISILEEKNHSLKIGPETKFSNVGFK